MQPVTPDSPADQPVINRAERRRNEKNARKAHTALMTSVSRLEFSQQLAPLVNGLQQHETILGFLWEKGLKISEGRAFLDPEEFKAWLAEKNAQRDTGFQSDNEKAADA